MKNICVYCGSNNGNSLIYREKSIELARELVKNKIRLIYGGANIGLMKILADEVMKNGGEVYGVITEFLAQKHLTPSNITKLIKVETMLERKDKMSEFADAFITMPGGFGTMDELFETLTAAQLGFTKKPIGILNINGFYDSLFTLLDNMVKEKLLLQPHREMLMSSESPEELISMMNNYKAPVVGKWIQKIIEEN